MNNGGWEIKVINENGPVEAVKNWWGTDDPIKNEIIGPVAVKPVLENRLNLILSELVGSDQGRPLAIKA